MYTIDYSELIKPLLNGPNLRPPTLKYFHIKLNTKLTIEMIYFVLRD